MVRRATGWGFCLMGLSAGAALLGNDVDTDRPCSPEPDYPSFLTLPAAPAIGPEVPVADADGVGTRWNDLIRTALRPAPKDFSWYREYGVWVCRFKGKDQLRWYTFPPSANASHIVGTIAYGRLLVAPITDLMKQGMQPEDVRCFEIVQLEGLEKNNPVRIIDPEEPQGKS
ncbi:MAG: hypothetical protein ACOYKZ_05240 [Chlamydiia bacterium]